IRPGTPSTRGRTPFAGFLHNYRTLAGCLKCSDSYCCFATEAGQKVIRWWHNECADMRAGTPARNARKRAGRKAHPMIEDRFDVLIVSASSVYVRAFNVALNSASRYVRAFNREAMRLGKSTRARLARPGHY